MPLAARDCTHPSLAHERSSTPRSASKRRCPRILKVCHGTCRSVSKSQLHDYSARLNLPFARSTIKTPSQPSATQAKTASTPAANRSTESDPKSNSPITKIKSMLNSMKPVGAMQRAEPCVLCATKPVTIRVRQILNHGIGASHRKISGHLPRLESQIHVKAKFSNGTYASGTVQSCRSEKSGQLFSLFRRCRTLPRVTRQTSGESKTINIYERADAVATSKWVSEQKAVHLKLEASQATLRARLYWYQSSGCPQNM